MTQCMIEGCSKITVAQRYCATHYKRFKRHGDATRGRPQNWGLKEKHPLYESWYWCKRNHTLVKEWEDFWNFVAFLKEKKSGHTLRRLDLSKPIGPDNFYWKHIIESKVKAEYQRKWRKANPEKAKNIELKKRFGITLEQYNAILERQGGVCAICNEKDPYFENLAVDHDHNTNRVRGLLCHLCNRALGMFKDDSERLRKALSYLK